MAPPRRLSNGRSPLINQQRQITSFFSPGKSPIQNPNPNPSPSPSPSPTRPKQKKPVLVIGPSPDPCSVKKPYSEEVVGKRIRVFWPMDKSWYEGCVRLFDRQSGNHLVQYDDAEEEVLDLAKENIEWVEEECLKSFRRLRQKGSVCEKVVVKKEDLDEGSGRDDDDDDDSEDEDWGKNVKKERIDDGDSEEVELEEEELESLGRVQVRNLVSTKRKMSQEKPASGKKSKINGNVGKGGLKVPQNRSGNGVVDPLSNSERAPVLTGDAAERFGLREVEKFAFLGVGRKDADGRLPGDVNYDPRTLYLPQNFLKSLSGGQRQWWEFKSKHMDKVLFFKMGKFYELFEMDAHIGARELELQYMKGEQPHCGFPEKNFTVNVEKLARKGYRVLVVEQTETPEQLELRRKEMGSKDKVVKREICAVVTKGTLTDGEMLSMSPDAAYLISVTESFEVSGNHKEDGIVLGVCVADVSTSRFMIGQFGDDSERHCLCTLLSELRPVEIIKPAKALSPETERVLMKHTRSPLVNDLVPFLEFWDAEKTVDEVRNIYRLFANGIGSGCLPDILSELVNAGENGKYALSALGGCLFYLRQAFMDETLLRFGKFEQLPCLGVRNAPQKAYMTLDAAALENLEIFENSRNGGPSGTLFAQLDLCATSFGKRLLKSWLARPLYDIGSIMERQDAIAGLKGFASTSVLEFQRELSRLPDMERLLARLFASCEANGRNANKVVLYEDAAKKQLQEFIAALRGTQSMVQACSSLGGILVSVESSLLHLLLTPGKGLPDIYSVLKHFEDAFDWVEANHSGRIVPHEGVDIEYDCSCKAVMDIESSLEKHLEEQRKVLRDKSIKYVSIGKETHLLEIPENLSGSVPQDYELRSSKKGFFRYWTPEIKKFLAELSQAESEKESKLKSIILRLIERFCEHHIKWRQLVSVTAELDVLISFAVASKSYEGSTCRPAIRDLSCSSDTVPSLSATKLGHPILRSDALSKCSFVPNDVQIGGAGHASFILLTGPNMGGKSTLLRQICLSVILAQVGADVPAESFLLSPVDQIFVRMGAQDHIMAGQSTFLTELSETAAMLFSATSNSLVALDELGRGTSTSDGQAIAQSVLEHMVHKIQCRGIFSTHYHRLAMEYENDRKVALCHMACHVGKGVGGVEEVAFLYRLTLGACPKSYGVNVARLAGLPSSVLVKAAMKSGEFEAIYGEHRHGSEGDTFCHVREDGIVVIQEILRFVVEASCHETSEVVGSTLLSELQQRASLILQGN
ncbi:MUTS homolog 6 [Tasmannia lanceolata]|uniref:MUTS homolog 6 n=1 Tax=Tasmannia lanceolata TaxID=3420 RepID=UPI004063521A